MNQHSNMDQQLKQLENQSIPDLSRQDEHWKDMKNLLQPGTVPVAKTGSLMRSWYWIAVACVAGFIIYLVAKPSAKKEEKAPVADNKEQNAQPATIIDPKDTTPLIIAIDGKDTIRLKYPPKTKRTGTSIQLKAKTHTGKDTVLEARLVNEPLVVTKTDVPDPKASLAAFFEELEKTPQEYHINSKRDTVLIGKDGTTLMIAANTFRAQGPVTILLKEYYSYEDIITSKLHTMAGNEQLVTGGMIHVVAMVDGKPVDIEPGRSIRWFVPDTSASLGQMEVFEGRTNRQNPVLRIKENALAMDSSFEQGLEFLDWVPGKQSFTNTYLVTKVKALDLSDNPFKSKKRKNGKLIGKFLIDANSKLTNEELESLLKQRYYYNKVKVKEVGKKRNKVSRRNLLFKDAYRYSDNRLGDTAWFDPPTAKKYELDVTDTITYLQTSVVFTGGNYVKRSFKNVNLNELADRFSVDIRTLGWINCDRFYKDNREKMDLYVNLNDTASNYYTVLVFDRIKSMVRGSNTGKQVFFSSIPKGEPARVISIGIQKGKTVAAMEPLSYHNKVISDLKFEATSPSAFREQAATLDE